MKSVVIMLTVALGWASSAYAQVPSAPAPEKAYAEFTVGPTFGNQTSVSLGGEGGYRFNDSFGVFVEGARIRNTATSDVVNDAQLIASAFGGSANVKVPSTLYDAGVSYWLPVGDRVEPYVLLGVGAASVSNRTTFSVGGTDVTSQLSSVYGVQLGSDLSGSYTKAVFVIGVGVHLLLGGPFLGDVSYRYGHIESNSSAQLPGINTNRLQFGIGVKF